MKNFVYLFKLIFMSHSLAKDAKDSDIKQRKENNKSELSNERINEIEEAEKERITVIRRSIIKAITVLFMLLIAAKITSYAIKHSGIVISTKVVQMVSVSLLFLAVWGLVGWEIQSMGGKTIPEQANRNWYELIYILGTFFLLLSYLI